MRIDNVITEVKFSSHFNSFYQLLVLEMYSEKENFDNFDTGTQRVKALDC